MGRKKLNNDIINRILELNNNGLSLRKIRDKVNKEFNSTVNFHDVRFTVKGKYTNTEEVLHELNDEVESIQRYEIKKEGEDKYYLLTHKTLNKTFKLNVKLVDDIFKSYSKHGLNLSSEEILQKYKLKPEVFGLIKNKLRLYKASDVISEYTKENATEEELEQIIHEATDENINRAKQKLVDTHEKKFKIEARKAFKKIGNFEYKLEQLREVIKDYKPREVEFKKEAKFHLSEVLTVAITDLHVGKKNTDRILEDLERIKDDIINSDKEHINIICLGDIAENLSQNLMHPGQHINLDEEVSKNPFELMIYISRLFQEFLIKIREHKKSVKFIGITGNHDRSTSKNEDDIFRTAGLTIYEFMKQGLSNTDIGVYYFKETITPIIIGGKHFILSHGEYGFNKKKPEDILWKYGRQDMFNIMLSGHTHEHKQQVGSNYAKIVVAPLAGPNDFDERLGLKGEVGYTKIIDNSIGGIEIQNVILK